MIHVTRELKRVSVPVVDVETRRALYRVYRVLHVEPLPAFAIRIVPDYVLSIPAQSKVDVVSEIRELMTRENELWVLEYEQPRPALFRIGYGGHFNALMMGYKGLADMFYPPCGTLAVSQTVGTSAVTLAAVPAQMSQLPELRLRRVVAANAGTSAASLALSDAVMIGTATYTYRLLSLQVPAGDTRAVEVDMPVHGALQAAASASLEVSAQLEWDGIGECKFAVGLGERVFVSVLNPLPASISDVLAIVARGIRMRVAKLRDADEPVGDVVVMYPFQETR
jgi:hypothetical protein